MRIVRTGDEWIGLYDSLNADETERDVPLVTLIESNNQFLVWMDGDAKSTSEKLWLVVKSLRPNPKGIKLNEGDIIKLGRLKFRIRKINTPAQPL